MAPARSRAPSRSTRSAAGPKSSGGTRTKRGGSARSPREQRALDIAEDRGRRAAPAPVDPTGEYHRRARELAGAAGVKLEDVIDEWDEQAALREYAGCPTRSEAERLAFADVEDRYRRRLGA
jgi:hypothetical protein